LCADQLTRLVVPIEHHEVTVLVCSACSWHTRLINGRLATANDLLTIDQNAGPPLPRAVDAVTRYRTRGKHTER
jgi:hypothetical protein